MAVHGKESPTTVRSLSRGGAIVSGGSASYDIVFACGSVTHRLPEAILRGVQWRIEADKGLASAEEIAPMPQKWRPRRSRLRRARKRNMPPRSQHSASIRTMPIWSRATTAAARWPPKISVGC
ncbi:hypothetical protein [Gluconobacter sphaericus]|uniref:hypothetical protein n=1 Tax=Gluconobacter sphaericus TaxID=574987 RepID=UPI0038D25966